MSATDISEFMSEGLGFLSNSDTGSELLNRGRSSLQDAIDQKRREANAFIGTGLSSAFSSSAEESDSKNNTNVSLPTTLPELTASISRELFGEDGIPSMVSYTPSFQQNIGRIEERQERRDGRGGFSRKSQQRVGLPGLAGVQEARDQLSNMMRGLGVDVPKGMTVIDGIDGVRQGLENLRGKSSGAGVLDSISNGIQMASNDLHVPNLREISDVLSSGGGRRELQDNDGDGDIDAQDLAISQQGDRLITEMRLLHPLIAKANRDPNFMRRKIGNKKINNEQTNKQENQVNLVQQGIAGHIQDVNMFQVSF